MTVFLRALEAADKTEAVLAAIRDPDAAVGKCRFEVDPASFAAVPRSPFAYWVSGRLRLQFQQRELLQARYTAIRGAYTTDDFRFYRLGWELAPAVLVQTRKEASAVQCAVPLAKGGVFSPYYHDVHLAVRWARNGAEAKAFLSAYRERKGWGADWSACLNGHSEYFRPGLTWPRRTQGGLSLRAMPAGCIFADKGPATFVEDDDAESLLALLAVTNSKPFRALVELQMAFGSYEVGVLQRTPVPDLSPVQRKELAALARNAWSRKRSLDTTNETSHAFSLPALLQVSGETLADRGAAWAAEICATDADLAAVQAEVDGRCFDLYGIAEADRRSMAEGFGGADTDGEAQDGEAEEEGEEVIGGSDLVGLTAELVSWAAGVALGRFDVRLAARERSTPAEPEPFDPLPVCSPGMLQNADGLPAGPGNLPGGYPLRISWSGILADDENHPEDLVGRVRETLEVLWKGTSDAIEHEACELLGVKSLRDWFRRPSGFFADHLKRYSKSRRQAPIYWPLSTAKGSYTLWLYYPRLTDQTLHTALADFVDPKLRAVRAEVGALREGSGSRSRLEELLDLENELEDFRAEIERVIKLPWKPNLNDGVLITASPLWKLFRLPKWQKDLKACWEKLAKGEYDWAHLAYTIWPKRVEEVCKKDRSIAIAHGLEHLCEVGPPKAKGKRGRKKVEAEAET